MTNEIGLDFYSYEAGLAARRTALHAIFDNNEYWCAKSWEGEDLNNFHLVVQVKKPLDFTPRFTPAIAFIVNKLGKSSVLDDSDMIGEIITQLIPQLEQGKIYSVNITSTDRVSIHISGEKPSIWYNGDITFNFKADATHDQITALEKLQILESAGNLRIKFAAMNNKGNYVGDAIEEYDSFFDDLPTDWTNNYEIEILTRTAGTRRAWAISSREMNVAAVAHETGLELLFLIPVGVGVASMAIYDLVKWGINKWSDRRKSSAAKGIAKAPVFLQITRETKYPNGAVSTETLTFPSPVDYPEIRRILDSLSNKDASVATLSQQTL
jgi:hypothetical protein